MKTITNLIKITDNDKKVSRPPRLTVADGIYKNTKKLARWIYKNTEKSEDSFMNAIKSILGILEYDVISVETLNNDKELERYKATYPKGDIAVYRAKTIYDGKEKTLDVMVSLDNKYMTVNSRGYRWYRNDSEFIVLNGIFLLGYKEIIELIQSDENINDKYKHKILVRMLRNVSKRQEKVEEIKGSIYYYAITKQEKNADEYRELLAAHEEIENLLLFAYNSAFQFVRERELNLEARAGAFETKKNINKSTQEVMENTKLHKEFKYIEIDNQVDLDKFGKIEGEILNIMNDLPKSTKPTLRFRKLKNYKALGLYYPNFDCISVDFRDDDGVGIQSFVHEYGHHLDYTLGENQLSMQQDFQKLYLDYVKKIKGKVSDTGKYGYQYYAEPTEVFARAYELYTYFTKKYQGNLIADEKMYESEAQYSQFDMELVNDYFNKLLG